MGWGCRHNNTIVLNRDDLNGMCNVFARRMCEAKKQDDADFYQGAYCTLDIIRNHEFRDQSEFFAIFDALTAVEHGNDSE